jgi:hypothetical protein
MGVALRQERAGKPSQGGVQCSKRRDFGAAPSIGVMSP